MAGRRIASGPHWTRRRKRDDGTADRGNRPLRPPPLGSGAKNHNSGMANQVFEVARTAMAVREYQDKPVPEDLVVRVVEAGRLTARGANRQPWHFVVVRERANLRALGSQVRSGPYIAK